MTIMEELCAVIGWPPPTMVPAGEHDAGFYKKLHEAVGEFGPDRWDKLSTSSQMWYNDYLIYLERIHGFTKKIEKYNKLKTDWENDLAKLCAKATETEAKYREGN